MWIVMIAALVASVSLEDREDVCYMLAIRYVRDRDHEIKTYVESNKIISIPSLKSKMIQDAFDVCVDTVQDEVMPALRKDMLRNPKDFYYLTNVPINKYKNYQDVKVSEGFLEKKLEITRRASMNPRVFSQDL